MKWFIGILTVITLLWFLLRSPVYLMTPFALFQNIGGLASTILQYSLLIFAASIILRKRLKNRVLRVGATSILVLGFALNPGWLGEREYSKLVDHFDNHDFSEPVSLAGLRAIKIIGRDGSYHFLPDDLWVEYCGNLCSLLLQEEIADKIYVTKDGMLVLYKKADSEYCRRFNSALNGGNCFRQSIPDEDGADVEISVGQFERFDDKVARHRPFIKPLGRKVIEIRERDGAEMILKERKTIVNAFVPPTPFFLGAVSGGPFPSQSRLQLASRMMIPSSREKHKIMELLVVRYRDLITHTN